MTIEILEGEPLTKDGLKYKYKVRKNYQPFKLKKPKPERPPSPPPMDLTPKARGSALGKCFIFFHLKCKKHQCFKNEMYSEHVNSTKFFRVPAISGNLVVKSKLPPQSSSSLEAVEPLP